MPGTVETGTSIHCKVYEDNQSTISMAQSQTGTFRTKHIGTKVHHFRQYVRDKAIQILHVPSAEQIADIFTKPLQSEIFIPLRAKLMGW